MYALENLTVGQVAESRMGHDKGRKYIIVAVLGSEFVLCVDGRYRTADKPKTKRIKHLKPITVSQPAVEAIANGKLTDPDARKFIEQAVNGANS